MKKLISFIISLSVFSSVCLADASRSWPGSGTDRVTPGNFNDVTTGDLSYAAWAKPTENAAQGGIVVKKRTISATTNGAALGQNSTDSFTVSVANGVVNNNCASGRDLDGVWTFILMTWDGTANSLGLQENNVSACLAPAIAIGSLSNTFNFVIGNNGLGNETHNGLISHVFFFPEVLNDWQKREIMYKPDTPVSRNAYNYWPVWGQSGGSEKEYSTSNTVGSVSGTSLSDDGPPIMMAGGLPL